MSFKCIFWHIFKEIRICSPKLCHKVFLPSKEFQNLKMIRAEETVNTFFSVPVTNSSLVTMDFRCYGKHCSARKSEQNISNSAIIAQGVIEHGWHCVFPMLLIRYNVCIAMPWDAFYATVYSSLFVQTHRHKKWLSTHNTAHQDNYGGNHLEQIVRFRYS